MSLRGRQAARAAGIDDDDDDDLDTLHDSESEDEEDEEPLPQMRGRAQTIDNYFTLMGGRIRIPKPKFWLRRGRALSEAAEQSLKIAGFTPDPDATYKDLEPLACLKDDLDKIIVTMEQPNFWKPTDGERFAIASLAEAIENTDEIYVKGWVVLKLNNYGQEQERALILTDKAYYTGRYSYTKGRIHSVKRHDLSLYRSARWGAVRGPGAKAKTTWICVLKMLDAEPTAMKKFMDQPMKQNGKKIGYAYTRGFRPRPEVATEDQHSFMAELAWAFYAVANRLTVEVLRKPRERSLKHDPSQMGVAKDTTVLSAQDPRDIRKAEEERRTNKFGSLRRRGKQAPVNESDRPPLPPSMRPGADDVDHGVGNVVDPTDEDDLASVVSQASTGSSLKPGLMIGDITGRGSVRSKRDAPRGGSIRSKGSKGSRGSKRRSKNTAAASGSSQGSRR